MATVFIKNKRATTNTVINIGKSSAIFQNLGPTGAVAIDTTYANEPTMALALEKEPPVEVVGPYKTNPIGLTGDVVVEIDGKVLPWIFDAADLPKFFDGVNPQAENLLIQLADVVPPPEGYVYTVSTVGNRSGKFIRQLNLTGPGVTQPVGFMVTDYNVPPEATPVTTIIPFDKPTTGFQLVKHVASGTGNAVAMWNPNTEADVVIFKENPNGVFKNVDYILAGKINAISLLDDAKLVLLAHQEANKIGIAAINAPENIENEFGIATVGEVFTTGNVTAISVNSASTYLVAAEVSVDGTAFNFVTREVTRNLELNEITIGAALTTTGVADLPFNTSINEFVDIVWVGPFEAYVNFNGQVYSVAIDDVAKTVVVTAVTGYGINVKNMLPITTDTQETLILMTDDSTFTYGLYTPNVGLNTVTPIVDGVLWAGSMPVGGLSHPQPFTMVKPKVVSYQLATAQHEAFTTTFIEVNPVTGALTNLPTGL